MKLKDLFSPDKGLRLNSVKAVRREEDLSLGKGRASAVQTSNAARHPFYAYMNYAPLMTPDARLYGALRESIPVIDAAIEKIVRLTGGFSVTVENPGRQKMLDLFVKEVKVGACQKGLNQFIDVYFDSLLTYGNAVGEMVLTRGGGDIAALYNARLEDVQIKPSKSALDIEICVRDGAGFRPVKYPELVLFTPLSPPAGEILGVSLLRSLPFVANILLKIYHSTGVNFQRIANLRYAVTYKPGNSGIDAAGAKDIANSIAAEWSAVMQSADSGVIKDFVAVGDVEIKVIGADNQMIETEIPVRQMLEQIVAKLGIPPFMLGLHWSSTERMSSQQADILTSELESYRRVLDGVITKICETYLRLNGYGDKVTVVFDDINLQDEVETANARYIAAQAALLERQAGGEKS